MTDTENTTGTELALANPATGEVIPLAAPAPTLLDTVGEVAALERRLADFRRDLELELVRRVDDATGGTGRTAELDGCKLEVNAPTEDDYSVEAVRRELGRLVEHGHKPAEAALRELIVTPPPTPPAPRVDKRKVNALKSSDDRALLAALQAARERRPTRRTVKLKGRVVEATAEEVTDA